VSGHSALSNLPMFLWESPLVRVMLLRIRPAQSATVPRNESLRFYKSRVGTPNLVYNVVSPMATSPAPASETVLATVQNEVAYATLYSVRFLSTLLGLFPG